MNSVLPLALVLATLLLFGCAPAAESPAVPQAAAQPEMRRFGFTYASTITELQPGAKVRVWVPVAQDSHEQQVELKEVNLPGESRRTHDKLGNALIYFEAEAGQDGQVRLALDYVVERREALLADAEPHEGQVPAAFTRSSLMIPVNGTLQQQLLRDKPVADEPLAAARQVYDAVLERMNYDKPDGLPWGQGNAVWACTAGVGNCSDFHSLFIGVARDLQIPARFEIGFPLPPQRGSGQVAGYHCWARFLADGRWIPVDISEADKQPKLRDYYFGNLTADRVGFTTGRDLQLDPPQAAGPVNFLIYPYVEVDGKPHTAMVHDFRYADLD